MLSGSYENRYMEDAKLKSSEQFKDYTMMEPLEIELTSNQKVKEVKKETKASNSSPQQDLDIFLLGDTGDSDDDPGTPCSLSFIMCMFLKNSIAYMSLVHRASLFTIDIKSISSPRIIKR